MSKPAKIRRRFVAFGCLEGERVPQEGDGEEEEEDEEVHWAFV